MNIKLSTKVRAAQGREWALSSPIILLARGFSDSVGHFPFPVTEFRTPVLPRACYPNSFTLSHWWGDGSWDVTLGVSHSGELPGSDSWFTLSPPRGPNPLEQPEAMLSLIFIRAASVTEACARSQTLCR